MKKKVGMAMGSSEIIRVRQQIEEEIEAMQRGFRGFAEGTARHEFVRARMTQIGVCHERLSELVGRSEATGIACRLYMEIVKG